jgi:hypothetical protein
MKFFTHVVKESCLERGLDTCPLIPDLHRDLRTNDMTMFFFVKIHFIFQNG